MAIAETSTPRISPLAPVSSHRGREYGAAPEYDTPAFAALAAWVEELRTLTQPDRVHWVDGSAS